MSTTELINLHLGEVVFSDPDHGQAESTKREEKTGCNALFWRTDDEAKYCYNEYRNIKLLLVLL